MIKSDILFTPKKRTAVTVPPGRPIRILEAFGAVSLVLLLLGIAAYWGRMGESARRFMRVGHPAAGPVGDLSEKQAAKVPAVETPLPHHSRYDANALSQAAPSQTTPILHPVPEKSPAPRSPEAPPPVEAPPPKKDVEAFFQPFERTPAPLPPQPQAVERPLPLESPPAGALHSNSTPNSKRIMIKNGDTLMDIASRYYPEDKAGGLRKIMSANPFISDVNWIYTGQELVLPGVDPDREGSRR